MPKEETIQQIKIRNVIGERDDLPKQNPRTSLSSRIRSMQLRQQGVPELIHLYGTLELNKAVTFDSNENIVGDLLSDGTYLYAGLFGSPNAKVVKVDLSDFTKVSTLTFESGEELITSLVSDGQFLYAGLSTNPAKIVKIRLSDFTKVSTLTFAAGEDILNDMVSDGSYLYAGLDTIPGKIVKINLSDFTKVSTLTLAAGENIVDALYTDGSYLYAGLDTSPGKIVKIDLSDFTKVSTLTLAAGEVIVFSLGSDGSYLYAGLDTSPGKIVKIDLSDFTKVSTLTLAAGENIVYDLFFSGTYLYAALYVDPAKVVKVDLSNFTEYWTFTLAAGESLGTALLSDGTYLYIGTETSPGKVIRKYEIPTSTLYERQLVDIHDSIFTPTSSASRVAGKDQILEVSVTSAANAGAVTLATVTSKPIIIESIIIHADTSQTANLTTCPVTGGASGAVTFVGAGDATQANLNAADKQVSWTGAVRLAAGKTIVMTLNGTGAAAVDLTVTIKYRAAANGGYLV